MVQSACGYRIHQSIFAIFGVFKLLQKQLKLQLNFEKSCQTIVKYTLRIEIFQNRLFFLFKISKFAEDFRCFVLGRIKRVLLGGNFYLDLLKIIKISFFIRKSPVTDHLFGYFSEIKNSK